MIIKKNQLPFFGKNHTKTHNSHKLSRLKDSTGSCKESSPNKLWPRRYMAAKSYYNYLFILIGFLSFFEAKSQDPFFLESQQIKGYLNPALTGINGSLGFKMLVKDQFYKTNKFFTGGISVEQSFPCRRVDIGGYLLYDVEGDGFLKTVQAAFSSVYIMPISNTAANKQNFRGGIKIANTTKSINWSKLTFSDQLDKKYGLVNSQGVANPTSFNSTGLGSTNYFSVSGGVVYKAVFGLVNKYGFTAGFAFDNITNAFQKEEYDTLLDLNQSAGISKISIYLKSELPFARKLNSKLSFQPSFTYQKQRTLTNIQTGFMLNYGKIIDGGLFLNFGDFKNVDIDNKMIIGVFRFPIKNTSTAQCAITLQYAHNISSLDNQLGQTFQVTLSYLLKKDGCNSSMEILSNCYDFIKGDILYEDAFLIPIQGISK